MTMNWYNQNQTKHLATSGEAVTSDLNGLLKRVPRGCAPPEESGQTLIKVMSMLTECLNHDCAGTFLVF